MLTLPRPLSEALRFTPEQFEQLCAANPDAVLELTSGGLLLPGLVLQLQEIWEV